MLLDAAEDVLRDEGYGAASSRRIAERAGVKPQLVYYYFETMDDLLLAAFQRRTRRGLERLQQDIDSDRPVHALWADYAGATDAKLTFEYMALANRHAGIKKEVADFQNKVRALQAKLLADAYERTGIPKGPLAPVAAALLIGAVTLLLSKEEEQGVTAGHDEVRQFVDWCLQQFD